MDKNVVLCENCNTVNDQSSRFCRYCGKELVTPVTVEQTDIPAASPTEPENKYGNTYTSNEILGVPEAEMAEFVGKNSDKVMKNFIRMRDKNSKISFLDSGSSIEIDSSKIKISGQRASIPLKASF